MLQFQVTIGILQCDLYWISPLPIELVAMLKENVANTLITLSSLWNAWCAHGVVPSILTIFDDYSSPFSKVSTISS